MALSLGDLFINLTADTSGLKKAEREVNTVGKKIERSFSRVGAAVVAAFSFEAVRRITLATDQLTVLQRRLVRFTGDAASADKTFKALSKTASQVGQQIGNVSSVFERFSLIRDEIGATNDQIILMTDTLAKLGALGGSSAEEVNNALRQLAQGLAGGVLRAEEFNSIIEQTPEIAKAIGEQMGLSMGEMRQAMLDGKLTSDRVFQAIIASSRKTNEQFEKMPKTISMTAQAMQNELLFALTQFEKKAGIIERLASIFKGAGEELAILNGNAEKSIQIADKINQLTQRNIILEERLESLRSSNSEANKVARERLIPRLQEQLSSNQQEITALNAQLTALRTGEETAITITKSGPMGPASPTEDELQSMADFFGMRAELTGNANAQLEAEFRRHQAAIAGTFEEGSEEFKMLQNDLSEWRLSREEQLNAQYWQVQQAGLNNLASVFQAASGLIAQGMEEGNAAAVAAFMAMKTIQVAQIIAATETSAALAATTAAPAGPFAWLATAQGVRATGYASAALVGGLSVGQAAGAFADGGIVPGNSPVGDNMIANVNSGEMILNNRQQKELFNMANGGGGDGSPKITMINNGTPMDVQNMSISRDEIMIMIDDSAKKTTNSINQSLASGRGTTAQSLQKGYRAERRL